VETTGDGESALAQIAEGPCDLVLLDLHMPGLNGMEVLRRLRDLGFDVPVMIVTAHGGIPDVVRAMRLGAIDFLAKPLTPDALRTAADEVLARHADHRPGHVHDADRPVTAASQFARNLRCAKRALTRRAFDEAEVFLKQAVALNPRSAEAHNLTGVLMELRGDHDASYRAYRAALKADRRYEPARHNMTRYYERFTFGRSAVPLDLGDTPEPEPEPQTAPEPT
jgi:DNA-binding response OmpR family regulator